MKKYELGGTPPKIPNNISKETYYPLRSQILLCSRLRPALLSYAHRSPHRSACAHRRPSGCSPHGECGARCDGCRARLRGRRAPGARAVGQVPGDAGEGKRRAGRVRRARGAAALSARRLCGARRYMRGCVRPRSPARGSGTGGVDAPTAADPRPRWGASQCVARGPGRRGDERGPSGPHPPTPASICALGSGRDECIHAQTLHRVGSRARADAVSGMTPQPVCIFAQSRLFSSAAAPEDSRKIFVGNLAWRVRSRALALLPAVAGVHQRVSSAPPAALRRVLGAHATGASRCVVSAACFWWTGVIGRSSLALPAMGAGTAWCGVAARAGGRITSSAGNALARGVCARFTCLLVCMYPTFAD